MNSCEIFLEYIDSQKKDVLVKKNSFFKKALKTLGAGVALSALVAGSSFTTSVYERFQRPPELYEGYKTLCGELFQKVTALEGELKDKTSLVSSYTQEDSLRGLTYEVHLAPKELDSLAVALGESVAYIDKKRQVFQIWQRTNFVLLEETLCSTGLNSGEKTRAGDLKTPSGPFTIVSSENSDYWSYDGERGAYGPYFFRMDVGAWDAAGKFYPSARSSIGIHGTNELEKLGKRASHSCIRINNDSLLKFKDLGYLRSGISGYVGKD